MPQVGLSSYQSAVARDSMARIAFLLPHDIRRKVFRRAQPNQHEIYATMREHDLGVIPGQAVSLTHYDRHECIFVHIPKNAGTSIGRTLFGPYEGNHLPVPTYQLIFSKAEFDRYFKFAFSRNPWDRLVSGYLFKKNGGEGMSPADHDRIIEPGAVPDTSKNHQVKARTTDEVLEFEDFEHFVTKWVNRANVRIHEHFRPQHRFVCSPDGELQLDFVGRFETLDADLAHVAERLEIDTTLMHENRTKGANRPYQDMYTPRMRKIVTDLYEKDIRLFDYSFGDG